MRPQFDEAYYHRFYVNPRTRVYDQRKHAKLVAGVVNLVEWFGVTLVDVLDVGAGLGWWSKWLQRHRPGVEVLSTELDPAICQRYGHVQADLVSFRLPRQFDLVICQGVLPYLDDEGAEKAIANLTAMCGGVLYLEAITKEDLAQSIDVTRTDLHVHTRTGAWYRKRLKPHFQEIGAGLYAARDASLPFYSLEAAGR
ncbi:MAG: class I SAM-dependent methyltransferase [Myxococcales bacterium]|nr:class I SAM-dependent methyltransferase [Myxococcales bacterium]